MVYNIVIVFNSLLQQVSDIIYVFGFAQMWLNQKPYVVQITLARNPGNNVAA